MPAGPRAHLCAGLLPAVGDGPGRSPGLMAGELGLDLAVGLAYACERSACQVSAPTVGGRSYDQNVAGRPRPAARTAQPGGVAAARARAARPRAPREPRTVGAAAGPP